MNTQPTPRLITIPISHFCEKARWALEWSRIPFREERHLQGFHILVTHKIANSDSVPVLVVNDQQILKDSTDILHWIDSQAPADRKLYPSDVQLRKEVDRLEDEFDEKFGVAGRLWMYTYLLDHHKLIFKYSKMHQVPWLELKLMPFVFPAIKKKMVKMLRMSEQSQAESKKSVDEIFNQVGKMLSDGRTFLVGNQLTAADLTFAALSAPTLIPPNYGVRLPSLEDLPIPMRDQIKIWRETPAGQFALRIYQEFRPTLKTQ